jgi:hypothetical protein
MIALPHNHRSFPAHSTRRLLILIELFIAANAPRRFDLRRRGREGRSTGLARRVAL